jgi:hypothetical protein
MAPEAIFPAHYALAIVGFPIKGRAGGVAGDIERAMPPQPGNLC